ncbi:hypothetical protein UFOVP242_231 [uncultured Caudovirales phage]|uniref:Uncharacterized protein n=1 Tax=uncultured Caudovirales phage TaxID=2100421 RepID=A0A6J7WW77_9CAUD|nr:hypothetical protein UFOVP242_231 [uncultured Caudovirales phage]
MTKVTNLSKAIDIVKTNVDARIPKAEILSILVKELGVSRSNAFVYFTKASKAQGFSVTVDKAAKAQKVSKTNVSMSSASKKAAKLAEIDAFLASNKSAVGNPFAALGA